MNAHTQTLADTPAPTMTATVDHIELRRAMALLMQVIERRNTIPVLSTVHFDISAGEITLTGTDLDILLSVRLDAETAGKGKFVLSARALAGFAAVADGPVSLSYIPAIKKAGALAPRLPQVALSSGSIDATINEVCVADDFPWMGEPRAPINISVQHVIPGDLRRAFALSKFCISTEETRYYLNGVYLSKKIDGDTLRAVATDGHRMAVIDTPIEWTFEASIVPTKTVRLLMDILGRPSNETVAMAMGSNRLRIALGNVTLTSKLIDGTFPDYTRVLPKAAPVIRADLTKATINRLARVASGMSGDTTRAAKIEPDKGRMSVEVRDEGSVSGPISGEGGGFGMNIKYLADMASVAPEFTIRGAGSDDPFIIFSEDPDAFWVLMPMRV